MLRCIPPDGIERDPTRGSASNTVAVFPRLFFRPGEGFEVDSGGGSVRARYRTLIRGTELTAGFEGGWFVHLGRLLLSYHLSAR